MDAQVISIAAGVISVAIAALGLLLTWYRHDSSERASTAKSLGTSREESAKTLVQEEEAPGKSSSGSNQVGGQRPRTNRTRNRVFAAAAGGVAVLAGVGILLTFKLGTAPEGSTGVPNPSASGQLSVAQYTGKLGQICSDTEEKARRIEESRPQESDLGAALKIEQDEVDQIRLLSPPVELRSNHENILALWQRRISFLESIYRRLATIDDKELGTRVAAADKMAVDLGRAFESIGVPECSLVG